MPTFETNANRIATGFVSTSLSCAVLLMTVGCNQASDAPGETLIANTNNALGSDLAETVAGATTPDSGDDIENSTKTVSPTKGTNDASETSVEKVDSSEDDQTGFIDDGETLIRDPVRVQKRQIVSKDGVLELTFDDLKFDIEVGEAFERDMLPPEIEDFDGKQIKIRGYIKPSYKQSGLKGFVFVRDDKECCFGPQAAIYDCMIVRLKKGTTTDFTVRPVSIEGQFYLKEYDGPDGTIWAIFKMRNAKVN